MITPLHNIPRPLWLSRKSTYADEVLADSPVSYWRLNEKSGTTAIDQTGTNPLTYNGSFTRAGALINGDSSAGSVTWDGASGYAVGGTNGPSRAPLSFEAWLVIPASPQGRILCKWDDGGPAYDVLTYVPNTGVLSLLNFVAQANTGTTDYQLTSPVTAGTHHFVLTCDASTVLRVYIDGSLSVSGSNSPFTAAGVGVSARVSLGAGMNGAAAEAFCNFGMAEVALYSSVLSAARVLAHYQKGMNLI